MLTRLHIHHFAIVDQLTLSFKNGMTVITGETGAGKSIIIDALSLLLGKPASDQLIKAGFDSAWVEATFHVGSPDQYPDLTPFQDHDSQPMETPSEFTFFRQISRNKTNRARINGQTVTLRQLKKGTAPLLYIVGQHHAMDSAKPDKHLQLIDSISTLKDTTSYTTFIEKFNRYNGLKTTLTQGKTGRPQRQQERDFIRFQLDDLTPHHFTVEEEDHLKDQRQSFKNRTQAIKYLGSVKQKLTTAHDLLIGLTTDLSKGPVPAPTTVIESISEGLNQLEPPLIWCDETYRSYDALSALTIDDIESRLDLLFRYKTKYHVNHTRELVSKVDELTKKESELTRFLEDSEQLQDQLKTLFSDCLQAAKSLHDIRKETAKKFAKQLVKDCLNLQFSHCDIQLNVLFDKDTLSHTGADRIEWLISTNKGLPVGPLSQVASGGELSRLMLAIESNIACHDPNLTMVFDEVDTGVGGLTARAIGDYLATISTHKQVLCITHLPQIAQHANHHLTIEKYETETSTNVKVTTLLDNQRPAEIKRMVGGDAIVTILK
jgi:DNA repair protein RecN (Recombination protein N)